MPAKSLWYEACEGTSGKRCAVSKRAGKEKHKFRWEVQCRGKSDFLGPIGNVAATMPLDKGTRNYMHSKTAKSSVLSAIKFACGVAA